MTALQAESGTNTSEPTHQAISRLPALDWMRGFVMILMAIDHGGILNGDHFIADSWTTYLVGSLPPAPQFYTRWITHLCAPTFLFVSGVSLSIALERRHASGQSERQLDRYLLTRGLVLLVLEILWVGPLFLQVLYAIGFSMILMCGLRRLSTTTLLAISGVILIGSEAAVSQAIAWSGQAPADLALALAGERWAGWFLAVTPFLHPGKFAGTPLDILYPVLPWLAMMILGWVFGRSILSPSNVEKGGWKPETVLLVSGVVLLAIFLLVRGLNGYGNMFILRESSSLTSWLHVSKYPPSLSFAALELGLMSLCLWALFLLQRHTTLLQGNRNPLVVFGQTALMFYVLHLTILGVLPIALGLQGSGGLWGQYTAAVIVLIGLYPVCRWYRGYKSDHPEKWVRFI